MGRAASGSCLPKEFGAPKGRDETGRSADRKGDGSVSCLARGGMRQSQSLQAHPYPRRRLFGVAQRERAELHERFADFQEQAAGDRLSEYEEVIGYHLEQATHYRQGLGRNDERTRDLARRAAQLLGAAGVRAIQLIGQAGSGPGRPL
jgi:hypothetical protein